MSAHPIEALLRPPVEAWSAATAATCAAICVLAPWALFMTPGVAYGAAALFGLLAWYRGRQALRALRYQRHMRALPRYRMRADQIPWSPSRLFLGRGFVWESVAGKILPVLVLVMLVGFVVFHVLLTHTVFGRGVIAVGSNEEAARLAGIAVRRTKLIVYVLTGALCGIVGVLHDAKLMAADPKVGEMWELNVIAAVVVGGTSLFGGRGTIWGTLIGALIIGVLNNSLNLLHVEHFWQKVVLGLVILLAALLDAALRRLGRQ